MAHNLKRTILAIGFHTFLIKNTLAQTVNVGWDATALPDGTVANWTAGTNTYTGQTANWNGDGTKQSGTTNFANVNDWINCPDYNLQTNPGDSWQEGFGDPTTTDASWELVFRPGSFTGNRHLFNTGGNVFGTAFIIEDSTLSFIFQSSNNDNNRVKLDFDLSTIGPATDFYHIVGTSNVDSASAGTGELWVNGIKVAGPTTSSGTINDWDGGNTASLGSSVENHNIPSDSAYTSEKFTGDIAFFNFYENDILDQTEVIQAYTNLIPEPSTSLLLLTGISSLCIRRQRK